MLPIVAGSVANLINNGMHKVADEVIEKGVDAVQSKLGMELKARGHRATYLMSYLAEGEAPDEARNVFQQRSRWTKGHYQVTKRP